MALQVKDFEEFLAQAMTSSSTTSISASPSLASSSLYSDNSPSSSPSSSDPSPSPSPSPSNDQDLDQLEQQHRNDDSFYDNLSFDTPPPQATSSSRSHAIYLNPHSQELSPMQLVTLSNLKLNNEVFSNRSLSIQKRILVKNLLTMLYTLHPPHPQEWHYQIQTEEQQEEEQGQPDKTNDQWTTLDAAGLHAGERSSSLQGVPPSPSLTPSQPSRNPFLNINSNTSTSSPSTSSSEPGSSTVTKVSLPRPKSTDLPQSLHSYLSTVFDVDWSVGLSTTEDSLFTLHSAGSSSSVPGSSSSMSGPGGAPLSSSPKRKSLSASSSLSLSLSLSDFVTPSGSGNSTHVGNTNGGASSSTASATSSSSSFSTSSSSTVSSISSASVGNGASSTPLTRKSSLPSSQPQNSNTNRPPMNSANSNSSNSTGGGETVVRKQSVASKPVMVPGRRSSLLQTGQMPTAVNTPSSSGSLSPGIGRNNSYTTPKSPTLSGSRSPTLSPYSHAPSSPSLSPTLSPTSSGSFSFGSGVAPPSPSLSPTLSPTLGNKPAISRRTSSLPTERPRQNQRLPSSENGTPTLSSTSPAGLPRPLQTSTMSSLSSSPPSSSTLASSGPKHHLQAPYPYSRSVSDEHINFSSYQQQQYTRHGASSSSSSSSSPPSPSHPPLPPISSSYSGVSVAATPSTSLAKPLPSYTLNKASKSSPNLGDGANGSNYYGDNHPALPTSLDIQYQQQFQQQFFQKSPPSSPSITGASGEQHKSSTSNNSSSSSSGFNKLLSRTSSRRGAVGNTTPESYAAGQGATSIGVAMTISAPLSLISSVDQEGFQSQHHQYHQHQYQYQSHPQAYKAQDSLSSSPRSYGHGYSQSVGGHSFGSTGQGSQPSSTTASTSSGGGGGGGGGGNRWSSMKTMLGLRVGQTKG